MVRPIARHRASNLRVNCCAAKRHRKVPGSPQGVIICRKRTKRANKRADMTTICPMSDPQIEGVRMDAPILPPFKADPACSADTPTPSQDTGGPRLDMPVRETGAARRRLVQAAAELFCRYGITATGVDAIVDRAGTAKATLYKLFGSKEGLVEAVLEEEGRVWRTWFLASIDSHSGSASEKLVSVFDMLEDWFSQDSFFGCPFINAVGESDKKDDRLRALALRHKSVVIERIGQLARETGSESPDELTHAIALLMDGAIVAAMVTGDRSVARSARSAAAILCAAHATLAPEPSCG